MRKFGIALIVLAVAGCGGSGSSTTSNPFAGTFSGPWSQPNDVAGQPPLQEGTITFDIDTHGNVGGTFSQTTPQARSGPVTGTVLANGDLAFSVAYSGGTVDYSGSVSLQGNSLTGLFGEVGSGTAGTVPSMDLTRQ